jgi:hypothetical protein
MLRFRSASLLACFLTAAFFAYGQTDDPAQTQSSQSDSSPHLRKNTPESDSTPKPIPPIAPNAPRISRQTRYDLIRNFEMQLVYARTAFPMGTKGLRLQEGTITPRGEELQQMLSLWGPAVRPGDPAHISYVQIKDDHIHFEINGGPIHRKKWYEHIEVSGTNGVPVTGANDPQTNAHGSYVDLYFDKHVPEMTTAQLRELLYPVLDFNAKNREQAYLDTVPPNVKAAIQAHRVLVGMNQEMVIHAKGKAPRKVRERDGETEYEEWIYGEAPADVDFVRFVGDEVVRVETMKVSGEKIVRTEKEVILQDTDKDKEAKKEKAPEEHQANAPSLRRPGEDSQDVPKPANGASPAPVAPPPDSPQPPSGPGDFADAITATPLR